MPSSVIAHIAYDITRQLLKITFHSGRVYAYYNVPDEVFLEMMKARSKGSYLNRHIKGSFAYKRLA